MGQALIRSLENDLLDDYREAAGRNGRSLEAELREALRMMRPLSAKRREALLRQADALRAMTLNVPQTPSEQLIRDDRDGFRDI